MIRKLKSREFGIGATPWERCGDEEGKIGPDQTRVDAEEMKRAVKVVAASRREP